MTTPTITTEDIITARHNSRATIALLLNHKRCGILSVDEETAADIKIITLQRQLEAASTILRMFHVE